MRMLRLALRMALLLASIPAAAWDRGTVATFAVLPDGFTHPEGLEVDGAGNAYVASFDVTGASGAGRIAVLGRNGLLLRVVTIDGASPQLLGLRFQPGTGALLVIDFGGAQVLD